MQFKKYTSTACLNDLILGIISVRKSLTDVKADDDFEIKVTISDNGESQLSSSRYEYACLLYKLLKNLLYLRTIKLKRTESVKSLKWNW
jgi:hypothetical protein